MFLSSSLYWLCFLAHSWLIGHSGHDQFWNPQKSRFHFLVVSSCDRGGGGFFYHLFVSTVLRKTALATTEQQLKLAVALMICPANTSSEQQPAAMSPTEVSVSKDLY